ncbi:hypothetical protein [Labrys neptuniae]
MTISAFDNRRTYSGDGSTVAFAFPPPFTTQTDLTVQVQAADGTIVTKALGSDYTVSGPPYTSGGTVTMVVAPAVTTTLIIYRDVPLTQNVTLQDSGPLPAGTVNAALDRITMWGQRLREMANAAFANATQTVAGLMSAADKYKLDGIAVGAQVNAVTTVAGRTGDVLLAKTDVGLGNVDNTSDVNKPVSTAQANADALALKIAQNLNDLNNKTTARTNLGVAIGTDVQAFNARLADLAGISWAQGDIIYYNGSSLVKLPAGTSGWFLRTNGAAANPSWVAVPGGGDLLSTNNLSDLTNKPQALTNLGGTATGTSVFTAASTAAARTAIGAGTGNGSVTSVAMTVPSFLSVSGSPISVSGTFAVTLSGTALPVANGGTGLTSVGTNGQILTVVSSAPAWVDQVTFRAPDLWVRCERAQGTADTPGSLTVGTYVTRALNTIKRNTIGATLTSNQITLPAGTYYARWRCVAGSNGGTGVSYTTRAKLYNVTASSNIELTNTETAYSSVSASSLTNTGETTFTIGSSTVVDVRQISGITAATTGNASNISGEGEVYSSIELWKVG